MCGPVDRIYDPIDPIGEFLVMILAGDEGHFCPKNHFVAAVASSPHQYISANHPAGSVITPDLYVVMQV